MRANVINGDHRPQWRALLFAMPTMNRIANVGANLRVRPRWNALGRIGSIAIYNGCNGVHRVRPRWNALIALDPSPSVMSTMSSIGIVGANLVFARDGMHWVALARIAVRGGLDLDHVCLPDDFALEYATISALSQNGRFI